jgi:hypothetical protein
VTFLEEVRKALTEMAYVEREPGVWIKPIGYQAFVFNESDMV